MSYIHKRYSAAGSVYHGRMCLHHGIRMHTAVFTEHHQPAAVRWHGKLRLFNPSITIFHRLQPGAFGCKKKATMLGVSVLYRRACLCSSKYGCIEKELRAISNNWNARYTIFTQSAPRSVFFFPPFFFSP